MQLAEIGKSTCGFVNEPSVKQGIKNLTGSVSFLFGMILLYDISQRLISRNISTEVVQQSPTWKRVADQAMITSAKLSILLTAATTYPGSQIFSILARTCCSQTQLEKVLGKSTIFEVNPWHPRHIASVAAVALATPLILQSIDQVCSSWNHRTVANLKQATHPPGVRWLTDTKLKLIILFNLFTSRPFLHQANRLAQLLFARKP